VFIAPPFKNEETNLYCLCVSDDGFIIICASWFIGTLPTTGNIGMLNCLNIGFTALQAMTWYGLIKRLVMELVVLALHHNYWGGISFPLFLL